MPPTPVIIRSHRMYVSDMFMISPDIMKPRGRHFYQRKVAPITGPVIRTFSKIGRSEN
jgi:hypothetical protein